MRSRWCDIRILFTHPFFWPHVRRGAEREIHDLGSRLVRRGHQVDLITSRPSGLIAHDSINGISVHYVRAWQPPRRLAARGVDELASFSATALVGSLVRSSDVLHCWHYPDAASVVRRDRPLIVKLTGSVTPEWIARTPLHDTLLRRALRRADLVWCNSEWCRSEMAGFGRGMDILPAGVDRAIFRPCAERSDRPIVISAGAPDEPRKRLVDVLDSWPYVRAQVPHAELRIAGEAPAKLQAQLLKRMSASDQTSVRFLGVLSSEALATEYSAAWTSVTAAVLEALGLTTLESLACGTPVVGADSGTTSALLSDPASGRLFPALAPAELGSAIVAQLAATPSVDRGRCRAVTDPYDWERIVDAVEAAYHARLAD